MEVLTHNRVMKNTFRIRIKKLKLPNNFDTFVDEWKAMFPNGMRLARSSISKIKDKGWGGNDLRNLALISLGTGKYNTFCKYLDHVLDYCQESFKWRVKDYVLEKETKYTPEFRDDEMIVRQTDLRQKKMHGILMYLFSTIKRQK